MRNARIENLSEHSLDVAIIAHALATIANVRYGREVDAERAALIAKIKEEDKAKLRAAMKAKEQKKAPKVEEEDEKAKLLAKIKEEEKARIKAELLAKERGMKDEA